MLELYPEMKTEL